MNLRLVATIAVGLLACGSLAHAVTNSVATNATVRGDLNGDGRGDLILFENDRTPFISFMSGLVEVASSYPLGTNADLRPWAFVASGNLDTNAGEEAVIEYDESSEYAIAYFATGIVTRFEYLTLDGETDLWPWKVVAAGDTDGDGVAELIARRGDEGVYAIGFISNNTVASSAFLYGEESDISPWEVQGAGDLDGDGRAELLARRGDEHVYAVAYLSTNGFGVTNSAYFLGAETNVSPWNLAAVSDLFGDGICDLVFRQDDDPYYGVATMSNVIVTGGGYLELDPEAEPSDIVGPR